MKELNLEEFTMKILNLGDEETWEMKCKDVYEDVYTVWFSKRMYKSFGGSSYFYVVYSYPFTMDAGFIQEDSEYGWERNIEEVWNDITDCVELTPFEE